MTNARYKKIQYVIRRLKTHMQTIDELCDQETTQMQNFGQHMEDEELKCHENINLMSCAFVGIKDTIEALEKIDP